MNVNEAKLVEALESDKYKQGRYYLKFDDCYCPLGVACEISGLDIWRSQPYISEYDNSLVFSYGTPYDLHFPPKKVREWLGWSSEDIKYVTELNDGAVDFDRIAQWIKEGKPHQVPLGEYMNINEAKLVEALESDRYKQGRGHLHVKDCFCPLGVACDISGIGHWGKVGNDVHYYYFTDKNEVPMKDILPASVEDWLEWRPCHVREIIDLNDEEGATFKDIAQWIRDGKPCNE